MALPVALLSAVGLLAPHADLVCVGAGPVLVLTAKLAAQNRKMKPTVCLPNDQLKTAEKLVPNHRQLGITFLPIDGPNLDTDAIEQAVQNAHGLAIAFDDERAIAQPALDIFCSQETAPNLKHVVLMSRYLNGKGMGFFANAAKVAANTEIWNANPNAVERYKQAEAIVKRRCAEMVRCPPPKKKTHTHTCFTLD